MRAGLLPSGTGVVTPYEGQTAAWYSRAVSRGRGRGRKRAQTVLAPLAFSGVVALDLKAAIHLLGRSNDESEGRTLAVVTMPDLAPLSAPRASR